MHHSIVHLTEFLILITMAIIRMSLNLLFIQISHVHNAAKDSEMVAMKKSWIYQAIFENRKGLVMNSTNELVEAYKKELDHYFLWVRSLD